MISFLHLSLSMLKIKSIIAFTSSPHTNSLLLMVLPMAPFHSVEAIPHTASKSIFQKYNSCHINSLLEKREKKPKPLCYMLN